MSELTLSEWRAERGRSLGDVAADLGLSGVNPARTLQRYERGERPCPLDVALDVERLTAGSVLAASFGSARRRFLETAQQASSDGDAA